MKKRVTVFGALAIVLSLAITPMAEEAAFESIAEGTTDENSAVEAGEWEYEEVFADWNEGAPALETLIDYVENVTDEASPDFIPEYDRIAVFDMDGTVYGELFPTYLEYYMLAWRVLKDPSIEPDAEMLEVGRTIRDCALDKSFPADTPMKHAVQAARAYAGLTLSEFADYVTEILLRDADGFEGMTYGEAFYLPIAEVIEYLTENDFKVYICSGSDRFICRSLIEGHLEVPAENIIGMDVSLEATGQNGADGLEYVFTAGDDLIRTDRLLIKNLKMNKVRQIVQEIGHQPVLSFGNSSGDVSMHMYTISNNAYRSEAFMLVADDDVRDYGDPGKAEELKTKWEESGFNVISMKNDFRTIYGDDVVKTGTFHWAEELADDRGIVESALETTGETTEIIPSESGETHPASGTDDEQKTEGEAEGEDVQYVLFLGTNDKDTNSPVYTREESMSLTRAILNENLGGYTIQEAFGGWVGDDGKEYQEYTLMIYLSDTTEEQVHLVADILIDTFHQSSVLIQTNPTKTEFYSGS